MGAICMHKILPASSGNKVLSATSKKTEFLHELRKNKHLFLMLIPAVVFFIIFNYVPMGGIIVAFKNYRYDRGILFSPWTGFNNFKFFFNSGKALRLILMTVAYNVAFIVTGIFFSVSLAIILSELKNKVFKKITHSIIFLPYFISWVVVAFMAYNLFSAQFGVVNTLLRSWGSEPYNFYGTAGIWKYLMVAFNNWKGIGYSSIIYLAVITGINPEYYETAQIDGASIWQRMRHITLPFLKPTIIILVLLSLSGILKGGGDMFYQLVGNNTLLVGQTDVIDAYILRSLINPVGNINYSMTAAVGLFQQAVGFILIMTVNYITRKISPDNAIF